MLCLWWVHEENVIADAVRLKRFCPFSCLSVHEYSSDSLAIEASEDDNLPDNSTSIDNILSSDVEALYKRIYEEGYNIFDLHSMTSATSPRSNFC